MAALHWFGHLIGAESHFFRSHQDAAPRSVYTKRAIAPIRVFFSIGKQFSVTDFNLSCASISVSGKTTNRPSNGRAGRLPMQRQDASNDISPSGTLLRFFSPRLLYFMDIPILFDAQQRSFLRTSTVTSEDFGIKAHSRTSARLELVYPAQTARVVISPKAISNRDGITAQSVLLSRLKISSSVMLRPACGCSPYPVRTQLEYPSPWYYDKPRWFKCRSCRAP